jgi:hypothetical protein
VLGKQNKPALFAVHVFAQEASATTAAVRYFCVRAADGKRTREYNDMCRDMGIPPYVEA